MTSTSRILALLIFSFVVQGQAIERLFNFDQDPTLLPPEGFVVEGGTGGVPMFAVMKNEEAKSPPNFLIIQGATFPGTKVLISLAWFSNIRNGDIQVWFKHGGEPNRLRTGGLVWRYQSVTDFYSLEWDTKKSLLFLVVTKGGEREILEKMKLPLPMKQWAQLRVSFENQTIHCLIDGQPVFDKDDPSLSEAGKAGIFINSEVPLAFDDFHLKGTE